MGRKDYRQQAQRGPGRKAKRQKDPKLPPELLQQPAPADKQSLSSRQKKRLKRRLEKHTSAAAKKLLKKQETASSGNGQEQQAADETEEHAQDLDELNEDTDDEEFDDESGGGSGKRLRLDLGGGEDDGAGDAAEQTLLDADDEDFLNDEFSDVEAASDEEQDDEDDDEDDEDDEDASDDADETGDQKKQRRKKQRQEQAAIDEAAAAAASESQADEPADLSELDGRIDDLLQALGSKGKQQQQQFPGGGSRGDCVDRLCGLLCSRFSYNAFLMRKLLDLYPKDILDFLQSNEVDRPLTLRVNALKTRRKDLAQALISRGVNLDPFDQWSKVGLVVYDSQVPLGATPEYLAGHYMLQGAASMLPVMALDPKPQEKLLDLCAAPGGKTTYAAELMRNTGLVMANEANRERAKAIVGNAHRHGLNNIVVCVGDGREFARTMHNFDRVLVDAPCTGTGVIAKDPAVKASKDEKDVLKCSHLQKQLLLAGIDSAKVGGTIVYCTCSVLVEENEAVVDYALRRRRVKLVDANLAIGEAAFRSFKDKKFHPSLSLARRITPHQHNMDGFFVAKLVKAAAAATTTTKATATNGKAAAAAATD